MNPRMLLKSSRSLTLSNAVK